jgi:hypothetical protein
MKVEEMETKCGMREDDEMNNEMNNEAKFFCSRDT